MLVGSTVLLQKYVISIEFSRESLSRDRILQRSLHEIHRVSIEEWRLTREVRARNSAARRSGNSRGNDDIRITPCVSMGETRLGNLRLGRRHIRLSVVLLRAARRRIFKHFWLGIPSPSASPAQSNSSGPMRARGIVFSHLRWNTVDRSGDPPPAAVAA